VTSAIGGELFQLDLAASRFAAAQRAGLTDHPWSWHQSCYLQQQSDALPNKSELS